MSPATVASFLLSASTLCGAAVVVAALNTPRNVRLTSTNMDLVLRWDPPEGAASDLVYTTKYKTSVTNYEVGCLNISTLECDHSSPGISIYEYATYTVAVQAQLGTESSAWVEAGPIKLDRDTIIGSPNVSLFPNGAALEISIEDPVFKISALRDIYNFATYNITYWKDGQQDKAQSISNIQQNRMVLNYLEPLTKYCVQVQINTKWNPKPSEPSSPVCETTTSEAGAPWEAAVVTFVLMSMAVALVVVAVFYHKRISHFLCPKGDLPQHFKEDLLAPPNSPILFAMRNSLPLEEIYHQVSIIASDKSTGGGCPQEAAGTPAANPLISQGEREEPGKLRAAMKLSGSADRSC
ncbi:interleukin-10 receptor subunit beta-like isoform 1-T1 [Aulostomus maculatus]